MKKGLLTLLFIVTFFCLSAVSASAVVNDTVKVGLRYSSNAPFSANLENLEGSGYSLGYFDDSRAFVPLGWTEETAISMTAAGTIYMSSSGVYSDAIPGGGYRTLGPWHIELQGFDSFEEAQDAAWEYDGGYPAWIDQDYVVRLGCYSSRSEAERAMDDLGEGDDIVQSSATGVMVTVTSSTEVLFEFDCHGVLSLGVMPEAGRGEALTWFKGYKYYGGFEYPRVTGGNLNVINVVNLESYIKGVIPYEMSGDWPLEALKAQAVCARTFASRNTKHLSTYGFDVCNTTDCQAYNAAGNGTRGPTALTDQAVDETAWECLYYDDELLKNAVYHAANGGATEDAANVWGGNVAYLRGKADPYEGQISIPNYAYSTTYTAEELTWILQQKEYSIGTVRDVYVSEFTPVGNVNKVTFVDTSGKTLTVKGETCRTIFYSSTYGKSVRSMRFDIAGGSGGGSAYYAGGGERFTSLEGLSVISGSGTIKGLSGKKLYVATASGTAALPEPGGKPSGGSSFTISGTGNGHNVGLSQYGAKAMAEQGLDYQDILEFYYTDVTIW